MINVGGIQFPPVWLASGTGGFFGEGYPFHDLPPWRFFKSWWDRPDIAYWAKTMTLDPRVGNMPLGEDFRPKQLFPSCIKLLDPWHVVNAVGLSNPGSKALFDTGLWQQRTEPFGLSFMAIGETRTERMKECEGYATLAAKYLPDFKAPVALQVNDGCPNVGHNFAEIHNEIDERYDILSSLHIPLIGNLSLAAPVEVAERVLNHPHCAGLVIGNTIPWGNPEVIPSRWWGWSSKSPLERRGFSAGGLSGRRCVPAACRKVRLLRFETNTSKPVVAGNGIQNVPLARMVLEAGADGINIGCIGIVGPWNIDSVVRFATNYTKKAEKERSN